MIVRKVLGPRLTASQGLEDRVADVPFVDLHAQGHEVHDEFAGALAELCDDEEHVYHLYLVHMEGRDAERMAA